MFNQGDLTAFANQFGMYIDISVCDKCLKPEGNSEHGFDCDEYKAIYGWVESRAREQIAGEIKELAPKLLARWIEAGDPWVENWNYLDEENARRIVEFIAAAIARGNL